MRDFDELKLARVIDACGGIKGRVKMQKIVYLLREMGYDLPFHDFTIRQNGPYSNTVGWAADILSGGEVIEEEQQELGTNTVTGQPVTVYSYRVRDEIAPLIRENFDVAAPLGKPPLNDVVKKLKDLNREVLEVAATQVFLEREGLTGEALEKELASLKGHLKSKFDMAKKLLSQLKNDGLLS